MSEEVCGVKVSRQDTQSGVMWKWSTPARYGVTVHSHIMWLRDTNKWNRGVKIEDKEEEGGWQIYPVYYDRANDEEEAWEVARKEIARIVGGEEGSRLDQE